MKNRKSFCCWFLAYSAAIFLLSSTVCAFTTTTTATKATGASSFEACRCTSKAINNIKLSPYHDGCLCNNNERRINAFQAVLGKSTTSLYGLSKFAMATAAVAAESTNIPQIPILLACFIPTLLGYYRSEYGVSYAYGLATSTSALLILSSHNNWMSAMTSKAMSLPAIPMWHAAAILFYGIRLTLFLAYRQIFIPKFQEIVNTIEQKANESGGRLTRTPFIFSCSILYLGLIAPTILTTTTISQLNNVEAVATSIASPFSNVIWLLLQSLVALTWFGFGLGAFGDLQKSYVKAKKGGSKLVTSGIYSIFRHPNYTGEIIGWTASAMAGIVAAIYLAVCQKSAAASLLPLVLHTILSLLGVFGINFVLMRATSSLERKQKENYANLKEYKEWIQKSWSGFRL